MTRAVVVLITAGSASEARRLAETLVGEGLAACVTIGPEVRSVYRWKGRTERARERPLVAKTTRRALPALVRRVQGMHSYEVPEVIALPATGGSAAYLSWVAREARG